MKSQENAFSSDKKGVDTKCYPSDLTDGQWQLIVPLLPKAKLGGRPRTVDLRRIVNGILYMARGGCSWHMLPHDFGPWQPCTIISVSIDGMGHRSKFMIASISSPPNPDSPQKDPGPL